MIRQEPPPAPPASNFCTIWDQQHENHQNGLDEMHQMQKVESKKKKKEVKEQPAVKEAPKVEKKVIPEKKPKKKEERTTQPAAPAPWVGHQAANQTTSLTKIQKTEAQRRQVEMTAQKERESHQKQLEMMSRQQESRDVKWNHLQMSNQVKTLDEIQAEEQISAEREERASKKKEVVPQMVGDIWNTGAHSMAWQQPKAWSGSAQSGQSNAGFWEDPVKSAPGVKQAPQMLSKSQTMATITTAKRQVQVQPQQVVKKVAERVENNNGRKRKEEKKKEDVNSEFTVWCNRTLHAMNGNVDSEFLEPFLSGF